MPSSRPWRHLAMSGNSTQPMQRAPRFSPPDASLRSPWQRLLPIPRLTAPERTLSAGCTDLAAGPAVSEVCNYLLSCRLNFRSAANCMPL